MSLFLEFVLVALQAHAQLAFTATHEALVLFVAIQAEIHIMLKNNAVFALPQSLSCFYTVTAANGIARLAV